MNGDTDKVKILMRLQGGFGMGDTIQFTVTLKHLARYRPNWLIDVQAPRGAHMALQGFCNRVWHNDEPNPNQYDKEVNLEMHEVYQRFHDRPSNKITYCLLRTFGIDQYDHDLCRYECQVGIEAKQKAYRFLRQHADRDTITGRFKAVILHYQGSSNHARKNLQHWQASEIFDLIRRAGRTPILFDWDKRSPLLDKDIACPGIDNKFLWPHGCGDAEVIAALISSAEVFIGVDSGPGKIASATDTPSLIVWSNHHPLQYHDPAQNTRHLIPDRWRDMPNLDGDYKMAQYFRGHYEYTEYHGEHGMISEIARFLESQFGKDSLDAGIIFIVPPETEYALFAAMKMQGIAQGRPIDVVVAGNRGEQEPIQTAQFLRGFSFVRSVKIEPICLLHNDQDPFNSRGHIAYISDGLRDDGRHYLIPQAVLQTGRRIEEWYPEAPVNWDVMKEHTCPPVKSTTTGFVLSHPKDLFGVCCHLAGKQVIRFWKPCGMDPRMNESWTNPAFKDRYISAVNMSAEQVEAEIEKRGWRKEDVKPDAPTGPVSDSGTGELDAKSEVGVSGLSD